VLIVLLTKPGAFHALKGNCIHDNLYSPPPPPNLGVFQRQREQLDDIRWGHLNQRAVDGVLQLAREVGPRLGVAVQVEF
jgi:hypothetical protein